MMSEGQSSMRLPSMESVVLPLAQFTKLGLYLAMWIAMTQMVQDILRNLPPGDAISMLWIPLFLEFLLIELIASVCSIINSKYTWMLIVLTTMFSITTSPILFYVQPVITLVIISLSIIELLLLNDGRIKAMYKKSAREIPDKEILPYLQEKQL